MIMFQPFKPVDGILLSCNDKDKSKAPQTDFVLICSETSL